MEPNGHLDKMINTLVSDMPLTKCAHCRAKLVLWLAASKVAEVRATEKRLERMEKYGHELDALCRNRLAHLRGVDRSMSLFQDHLDKETELIHSK
ncbi:hypothetical protein GCK32_020091 [Trichostrongylus colubriformis]|uniref:Uncharacterized protein n=1 Tax=Trichostrongylus colubriformis TaxID=6319 RepID=A0AAN8IY05_TRICO